MPKQQLHFEEVPIETIKSILEEEAQKRPLKPPVKIKSKAGEALLPAVAGEQPRGRR